MQTFLPYPNFIASAQCLDYKRLGKQRVEAKQILNILLGRTSSNAWKNHPAVKMWRGYEDSLQRYYNCMVKEWIKRGYNNNMLLEEVDEFIFSAPEWLYGIDPYICKTHRSNLLRKNPIYYAKFGWKEKDDLGYFWPI